MDPEASTIWLVCDADSVFNLEALEAKRWSLVKASQKKWGVGAAEFHGNFRLVRSC